jgi:hypothetical protein
MKIFALLTSAVLVITSRWSVVEASSREGPFLRNINTSDNEADVDSNNAAISSTQRNNNGPLRQRFLKIKLQGVRANYWNVFDIDSFDHAVQVAYDTIHGDQDGFFWFGQQDKKIERKSSLDGVVEESNAIVEGELQYAQKANRRTSFRRIFDVYTLFQYTCHLCPPELVGLGADGDDPGTDLLDDVSAMVCKYLAQSGDDIFEEVHDCEIEIVSEEIFAQVLVDEAQLDHGVDVVA